MGGSIGKWLNPVSGPSSLASDTGMGKDFSNAMNPLSGPSSIGKDLFGEQGRQAMDPLNLFSHPPTAQVDYTDPGVPRFGSGNIAPMAHAGSPVPMPQPGGIAQAPPVAGTPPAGGQTSEGIPQQLQQQLAGAGARPPSTPTPRDPRVIAGILTRMRGGRF